MTEKDKAVWIARQIRERNTSPQQKITAERGKARRYNTQFVGFLEASHPEHNKD